MYGSCGAFRRVEQNVHSQQTEDREATVENKYVLLVPRPFGYVSVR